MSANRRVEDYIRTIPNFPEEGIMFRDITTLIQDTDGFRLAIDSMTKLVEGVSYDVICGAESRGFIFSAPIAYNENKPLVLVRKKGKLPFQTISVDYELEYGGVTTLEIHEDAIQPGQKVLLVDDLLATGGTLQAMAKLVKQLGGEVAGILVLLELAGLKGREFLKEYPVFSVVSYPGK